MPGRIATKQELLEELNAVYRVTQKLPCGGVQALVELARSRVSDNVPYSCPEDIHVTIELRKGEVSDFCARAPDYKQMCILANLGFTRVVHGAREENDLRVRSHTDVHSLMSLAEMMLDPFGTQRVDPKSVRIEAVGDNGIIKIPSDVCVLVHYVTTDKYPGMPL